MKVGNEESGRDEREAMTSRRVAARAAGGRWTEISLKLSSEERSVQSQSSARPGGEDLLIKEDEFGGEDDRDPAGWTISGSRARGGGSGGNSARGEEISPNLFGRLVPTRFLEEDR